MRARVGFLLLAISAAASPTAMAAVPAPAARAAEPRHACTSIAALETALSQSTPPTVRKLRVGRPARTMIARL